MTSSRDEFDNKGAVEQDKPKQKTNTSLTGQLGHRDQDFLLKQSDTDFPEEGNSPEHSGEPNEEDEIVDQDPGEAQKRNQDEEDDPLAA